MFRKIVSFVLALSIVLTLSVTAFAANPVKLIVDGTTLSTEATPIIINGTTVVPISAVSSAFGALTTWDAKTRKVTVNTASKIIVLTLNSKTALVNNVPKTMQGPATIVSGRTMVPVRFIAETLGADVNFEKTTNSVVINYFSKMSGSIKNGGSTTVQPITQSAADMIMKKAPGLTVSVAGGGSGAGVKGAGDGTFNIGSSSRDLTADELAKGLKPFTIAHDGIMIIVNKANPVNNLTKAQLSGIFLGNIKNWNEVGGENAPILLQTREASSGTLTAFEELVLAKAKVFANATPYSSNGLLKEAVDANKNAIGFVSVGFGEGSKGLSIDGILCTMETVKSRQYPFCRDLYVITKGLPTSLSAMFIDYLRSMDVQNALVKEGYISIR
jgi:phosphate transport system substrate-binding protein